MNLYNKIKFRLNKSKFFIHETKKNTLMKYLLVISILILYFVFISIKYNFHEGIMVTLLTWSFFVFCTPIADAGFLIDFPIRLITQMRMIYSEIFVWILAALINIYSLLFKSEMYDKTAILKLFQHILSNPFPFWIIILLSAMGTFLSIYFGDELFDVAKHKHRKKYFKHKNKYFFILIIFIIASIILLYIYLLEKMGLQSIF